MSLPAILTTVFAVSLVISLVAAARLSRVVLSGRAPEHSRHWSKSDTPRIGGVAVFLSTPIALIALVIGRVAAIGSTKVPEQAGALVASAAILFTVGLLDDIRRVKPLVKLVAQAGAAMLICSAGFRIEHIAFGPGVSADLGVFAVPVTVLWLVGVSNAFNLIDGMDGLAGGVAIIGLATTLFAALFLGNPTVPIYTVALIGALIGFLRYNWPSAKLFMGDSGSLVVGFLLAVLSVKASTDGNKLTYGLVPIFALAYPLMDTGIAMLRRWLRGVPLSRADRRHVHHRLRALGLGPTQSLLAIYCASTFVAMLGLFAAFAPPEVTSITTIFGVTILFVLIAVSISWLQYHEFTEAGTAFANAARSAPSVIRDKIHARDIAALVREAQSLGDVQEILENSAPLFRFAYMKLDTPQTRARTPGRHSQELQALKMWKLEYPIVHGNPEHYDGLCLTIWADIDDTPYPASAERVANIIGPTIAQWAKRIDLKPLSVSTAERLLHAPYTPVHELENHDGERRPARGIPWNQRRKGHNDRLHGGGHEERASNQG